jgi:hypothetical protein
MNNTQKAQRPSLNFKASKHKATYRRKSSSNDQNQEDTYRGDDAGDNDDDGFLVLRPGCKRDEG